MSGWGCEHEVAGQCRRLGLRPCDPGTKGCVLHGRYRFTNPDKNRPHPAPAPDDAEHPSPGKDRDH